MYWTHQGRSKLQVRLACDGKGRPLIMPVCKGQMSDYYDAALMIDAFLKDKYLTWRAITAGLLNRNGGAEETCTLQEVGDSRSGGLLRPIRGFLWVTLCRASRPMEH
jgi:hypothetical protein